MSDPVETTTETTPAPDASEELITARLDAAAARHGLDDSYSDVARVMLKTWLSEHKLGPQREHVDRFVQEMKTKRPALFTAARRADTAPVRGGNLSPSPGQHGTVESPHSHWRALIESGARAEAEAYYAIHKHAIRSADR